MSPQSDELLHLVSHLTSSLKLFSCLVPPDCATLLKVNLRRSPMTVERSLVASQRFLSVLNLQTDSADHPRLFETLYPVSPNDTTFRFCYLSVHFSFILSVERNNQHGIRIAEKSESSQAPSSVLNSNVSQWHSFSPFPVLPFWFSSFRRWLDSSPNQCLCPQCFLPPSPLLFPSAPSKGGCLQPGGCAAYRLPYC